MPSPLKLSRQNVFVIAFFLLLAGLIALLFTLLGPFIRSFLWAVIFAMVFYPLYHRLYHWMGKHSTWAALVTTLIAVLLLSFPGFYILSHLGKELAKAYTYFSNAQWWEEKSAWFLAKLQAMNIGSFLEKWGFETDQIQAMIQKEAATGLQELSQIVLAKLNYILNHLAEFVLQAFFVIIALFFFFRDGARYAIKVIELLPMEKVHQAKVSTTLSKTVTAVVRAIFLTSLIQGFLTGVGLAVAGVPLPVFFGVVAFINSFIPFLGAASVWIPSAVWLFTQDQVLACAGLTLWGCVITVMDHILRPWLIGSEAKLPLFWLFFTTIGGLKVYGVLGIFLGPIILSLGIAFLAIYREIYLPTTTKRKSS